MSAGGVVESLQWETALAGTRSIDTLRGLACLLLVGYHVIGNDSETGLRLSPDHVASQTSDALSLIRMPLFSFLSGLVYALRPLNGPIGPFASGKVRRLLLPLLLVGTAFAALQSVIAGTNGGGYDWSMLHIVPVAHFWFLQALFIIFMVTAVLERLHVMDTPTGFGAVLLLACVLHVTAPLPVHFGLLGATFLWPFFLMGVAAHRFSALLSGPRVMVAAVLIPAVLILSWLMTSAPSSDGPHVQRLLVSLCACLVLLRLDLRSRWLAWVGAWSFGIYLFHPVFTAACRMLLRSQGVNDVAVLLVAGLAAGLAGSIALTAALRRLPLGHLALGEKPRRARSRSAAMAGDPAPTAGA